MSYCAELFALAYSALLLRLEAHAAG